MPSYKICKGTLGPNGYAKRNIMLDNVSSAFRLILDNRMTGHIKACTELQAGNILQDYWEIIMDELYALIDTVYDRGAYGARNTKLSYLSSTNWGSSFFLARNYD